MAGYSLGYTAALKTIVRNEAEALQASIDSDIQNLRRELDATRAELVTAYRALAKANNEVARLHMLRRVTWPANGAPMTLH
jgi:hypothetical protein